MDFRLLRPSDVENLQSMLRDSGLPSADVTAHDPTVGVAVEREGVLVGAGALEIHGRYGLLRSVVVDPVLRGTGLGSTIVAKLLDVASTSSLDEVWLLTETAEPFFTSHGFEVAERSTAPEEIMASSEFSHLCPDSATAMVRSGRRRPAQPVGASKGS